MWQIVGQSRAVSLLQRGLERGSLGHAYLVVGPAHAGKMTLAINLAQSLNCEAAEPPCGECAACQKIASSKHSDVQIIGLNQHSGSEDDSRTEISIEQIRQLQHSASLPPFEGKHKVFIIDGAEFLSNEAANCLLKTLEEPTGKVIFILLTTNESLLPATVVSRCQRVELTPVPVAEIEEALNKRWGIEQSRARLLARLSHGCPGWAVLALDDGLLKQRADYLNELLEINGADYEERFTYANRWSVQFGQNRGLVQEKLDLWLTWWRDLLLVKLGLMEDIVNIDQSVALIDMAKNCSLAQIRDFIESIQSAGTQLKLNASPRLVLEVLMLNLPAMQGSGERKHG